MLSFIISTINKELFILWILLILIGGGLIACSETKDTQTLISEAIQYQQHGDDKAAIIQLKNAIKQSPENAEARYLLGIIYGETGDLLSAEKELSRALSLGMESEKILPTLSKILFDLGKFQQLLDKTEQISKISNDAEIFLVRGSALLELGKHKEAKNIFEKLLREDPDNPGALIGLAKYSLSQNDLEATIQLSEQAVVKNPNNVEAWLFKADLLRAQNKIVQALAAYDQVIKLNPDNISAYISRATIEIGSGKFDAAKQSIEAARKISPNILMVNYAQAFLDFNQGKHAEALRSIQQVIRVAPDHLPSVLLAGAIQFSLGAYTQAEQHLDQYLRSVPDNLYARKLMASTLLKTHQTQRAINILTPTLDTAENDPQLLALAGEAYMQAKDFSRSTEYFEKANTLIPNNAALHTALGMSKLGEGDNKHGIEELEFAATLDSKSPKAGMLLALTHLQLKQYTKAMSAVDALLESEPNNPLFHNLKGGVYLGLKKVDEARASFNKALSLHPEYFPAVTNLARLDIQENKPNVAKQRFEAILQNDNKNIQAMNALASLAHSQGNAQEAIKWLELASRRNPDSLQPAIQLAAHYMRLGDKKKSLVLAQKLYGLHSNEPRVLEILGLAQLVNDNKAEALETYNKLAARAPKSASIQLQIAKIHNAMQNHSAALTAIRRALSIQPDFLEALIAQAKLSIQNENYNEAAAIADKLQNKHSELPIGHVLKGDLFLKQKKYKQAIEAYENAFSVSQTGPLIVKLHRAMNLAGLGTKATTRLNKWLAEHPEDATTRLYLAGIYLEKQQYDAAIKEYQAILQLHPEHTVTLNNLAWLYQQKKDPRALEYAEKAYKQAPEAPLIQDTLGWILVEQGDITRAIPLLQKAASLAPKATDIQYHLAFGLAKSGEEIKARRVLEQLLETGETFPKIEEAKALLKQIQ